MAASKTLCLKIVRVLLFFILLNRFIVFCNNFVNCGHGKSDGLNDVTFNEDLLVSKHVQISTLTVCVNLYSNTRTLGLQSTRSVRFSIMRPFVSVFWLLSLCGDINPNPGPEITNRGHARFYNVSSIYWNARSCAGDNRLEQLNNFARDNSDFDLICLSETWLHAGILDGEVLDESQYTIHHRDRPEPVGGRVRRGPCGGGVLMGVSTSLQSCSRPDLDDDTLEAVWAEIKLSRTSSCFAGTVYIPRASPEQMSALRRVLLRVQSIMRPNDCLLLFGDFNMRRIFWSKPNANCDHLDYALPSAMNATELDFASIIAECDLKQIVHTPTREANFLDLILVNSCDFVRDVRVHDAPIVSDHLSVECCFSFPLVTHFSAKKLMPDASAFFNFSWGRARSVDVGNALDASPWHLLDTATDDPDRQCSLFYDILHSAFSASVPLRNVTNKRKFPHWFKPATVAALKDKNRAYRQWLISSNEPNKRVEYEVKRSVFHNLRDTDRKKFTRDIENKLLVEPKSFWRYLGAKKRQLRIPVEVQLGGERATDAKSCCSLFSEFFKSVFLPASQSNAQVTDNDNPLYQVDILSQINITPTDVEVSLSNLKSGTSLGPDGIPVKLLKACKHSLAVPLSKLFSNCVHKGVFPKKWKCGRVIPVLKKGSRYNVSNYRPITLLSTFSKVFESILHRKLLKHVSNCLSVSQHGFVPRRSTVTNLAIFTGDVSTNINNSIQTDAIYTDFTKAFDTVDHSLLMCKLEWFGLSGSVLRLFKSYLCDRKQSVCVNGEQSDDVVVTSGVPQGSILGPLLFVLYVNDLPKCVNFSNVLMYADDVKLYKAIVSTSDCKLLQMDLDAVYKWCCKWKLALNISKCSVITFTNKRDIVISNYFIGVDRLHRNMSISDLGVTLSANMSFNQHVDKIIPKAMRMLGFIRRNCARDFRVSTLRMLYTSLVCSALNYASPIWNPNMSHATNVRNLESVQRKFIKIVCFKTRIVYHRCDYRDLCKSVSLVSLENQRNVSDVIFLFKIVHNMFDVLPLLNYIQLRVPSRRTRQHGLFMLPKCRVNIYKYNCFNRIQECFNTYVPLSCDIFLVSLVLFKKCVKSLQW